MTDDSRESDSTTPDGPDHDVVNRSRWENLAIARQRKQFGDREVKFCENPLCNRITPVGILYCCNGCSQAHSGKYEIHEDGPLGHSPQCNERHAARCG